MSGDRSHHGKTRAKGRASIERGNQAKATENCLSNRISRWAWSQAVDKPSAKLVLVKLADFANDDGICWPSLRTIAAQTELSRDTVIRSVRFLQSKGLIRVTRRSRDGLSTSNKYLLLYETKNPAEASAGATQEQTGTIEVAQSDSSPLNKPTQVVAQSCHAGSTAGSQGVAQPDTNHHIEPSIEPLSLSKKELKQSDFIQHAEAKRLFGKLCHDVFGEPRYETDWPEDELHWLNQALPIKRQEWEMIDWFYRLKDNHEAFDMTYRRQSMKALIKNLKTEIQKVRSIRKRLQVEERREMNARDRRNDVWTPERRAAFEAMFPGCDPGPWYLLDRDLRKQTDEKAAELRLHQ